LRLRGELMTTAPDLIQSVEAFDVRVPLPRPLPVGSQRITARHYTLVRIRCASGVEGVGHTFSRGLPIAAMVRDMLAPAATGEDAAMPEAVRNKVMAAYWPSSDHGTFTAAVSALDLAVWDAMGKRLGAPVARLLGQARGDVPVCVVAGYVYDDNDATLRRELEEAVALGARSIKLVAGADTIARDRRRLALARQIAGTDVLLAVDLFRSCRDLDDAIRRVRAFAEFDLSFVEDPFSESVAPLVRTLRERTGVVVALGESLAGHRAIRALIGADAVDVVRLDALVIGGVREFMSGAALASAHGLPVATHVHTDVHVHFAAAIPNLFAGGVEYMPPASEVDVLHHIQRDRLQVAGGRAHVPDRPGFGIDWDWKAIGRFTHA
jgi:L-alanine-DL-glutamate epimerase-like enolase superfamily enzyme